MRPIIFRGIREDNGEWAYGSLVRNEDRYILVQDNTDFASDYYNHLTCSLSFDVKKETVGQYTGLKDKNKNLIWEGDIYLAERSYMPSRGHKRKGYPDRIKVICVVEWDNYHAGWSDKEIGPIKEHIEFDKNTPYDYYHTSLSGSQKGDCSWIEVIGNQYENPDLLTHK